jgi:hypothetical protein
MPRKGCKEGTIVNFFTTNSNINNKSNNSKNNDSKKINSFA